MLDHGTADVEELKRRCERWERLLDAEREDHQVTMRERDEALAKVAELEAGK